MKRPSFQGFPARMSYTPLPSLFFTLLLPAINDPAELKVTLHLFWLFSTRRTYPRFVTASEMIRDATLQESLSSTGDRAVEALQRGLILARGRGTFLHVALEVPSGVQDLYFLNTERDRRVLDQIQRGELDLGQLGVATEEAAPKERPNIFALYEENIGMITPLVAEELKDAEKTYSAEWIEAAFREAVNLNRRNWRYIARILENWATEGKDAKDRRDTDKDIQPAKYLRGKYARIVKH